MTQSNLASKFVLGVMAGALLLQVEARSAPNAQLCAVCPDPTRDIGADNLPPKKKTGAYMWVSTTEDIDLVRDPDWSGDVPEVLCKRCPDPFSSPSWGNLPVVRDHHEFKMMRKVRDDGSRFLSVEKNPNWNGERSNDSGEKPEEGTGRITDPVDRSGSTYHVMGQDVFQRDLLNSIGGVLSQGILELRSDGLVTTVEVVLEPDGEYPGHIMVNSPLMSGLYRIRYEELVPMMLFIDSGGTSLFTLWSAEKLPDNFAEDAGFVEATSGPGHVAIEFAGTRFEDALIFLDMCTACVMVSKSAIEAEIANHLATADEPTEQRSSSYINTDVDTSFQLFVRASGRVAVSGAISRFYWSDASGTTQEVSVERVRSILDPEDMRSNSNRMLDILLENRELEDRHLIMLMQGVDAMRSLREEAGLRARRRLADAFYLFETLALLRSVKRSAPDQWSSFVGALRSDWLAAQHSEPWERFTKTRCEVFPGDASCG